MSESEITRQLIAVRSGDRQQFERLFELVYARLKAMARRRIGGGATPTLDATSLVHEAYIKLVDADHVDWRDRKHFFAVAGRALRQILIDHARARSRLRRGGGAKPVTFDEDVVSAVGTSVEDVLAIDAALTRLAAVDPRLVQVVELCFFSGLSTEEAGEVLEISARTVKRDWRKAKALLHEMIRGT